MNYMVRDIKNLILTVSGKQWIKAQEYERNTWVINNKRNCFIKVLVKFARALKHPHLFFSYLKYCDFFCGDDWNYWWMEKFENYKKLPDFFEKALEVGCGPYTNIRLISKHSKIKEIYCLDPLVEIYKSFKLTWLSVNAAKNRIKTYQGKCENIKFSNDFFDLIICINVLDHVQDADKCLEEISRTVKRNGYLVLAQDLTNAKDLKNKNLPEDADHPIKLHHNKLDMFCDKYFTSVLKKKLTRNAGRAPNMHYGTYIFIGKRK